MKTTRSAWISSSIGLGLGLATGAFAADSAAIILPPQAGVAGAAPLAVPSAAPSDLTPSEPPPVITPPRDPNFQYPETYNSKPPADPLNISGLWRWLTASGEKKMDAAPVVTASATMPMNAPAPEDSEVIQAGHKPLMGPPPVPPPPPNPQAPAWRWYGYGAPVPGSNPYAPDGVYEAVDPSYYYQTGSTPGAIPQPLLPISTPTLPVPQQSPPPNLLPQPNPAKMQPTTEEPPKLTAAPPMEAPVQPALRQAADWVVPPVPESRAATLEPPFPHTPAPPPEAPLIRGQAPDPVAERSSSALVPDRVVASLRVACTGYATKVEITPRGEHKLELRLSPAQGVAADRLGAIVAGVPEMAGYEVEMEFDR